MADLSAVVAHASAARTATGNGAAVRISGTNPSFTFAVTAYGV